MSRLVRMLKRGAGWLLGWVLVLVPASAWARAGGGGGYGGGGGSSGGGFSGFSGGGGGGSGDSLPFWVWMPLLGAYAVYRLWQWHSEKTSPVVMTQIKERAVGPVVNRHSNDTAVATMQSVDPAFDAQVFADRFQHAFLQIQAAWQQQNMQPVQHFVSDGIFERFSLQILEQRDMGYRDHMKDIKVLSVLYAEAASTHVFDTLTVRVEVSAVDYRVSIDTGQYISGDRTPSSFTEFWSFVRRSGAMTEAGKPGLIEGNCPNCGDAIEINQLGKCSSCDAVLRSGQHDWVLAEITQACEWRPGRSESDGGAHAYRSQFDPGFNVQHMEDRASVIFWRKAMADRLDRAEPLLKMATEGVCANYGAATQGMGADGYRAFVGDCSVGSVELRGMVSGDEMDHALVEIRWSGSQYQADATGAMREEGGWGRFRSLYVLMRRHGVQTNLARTIDSAHCPSCGAPESDLASHACQYCEAVLNTGEHDWVLADVLDANASTARVWLDRALGPTAQAAGSPRKLLVGDLSRPIPKVELRSHSEIPSQADALVWMIYVLAADGKIHDDERATIAKLAEKEGMPMGQVEGLIGAAIAGELEATTPPSADAGKAWLEQMADVALADGVVENSERSILLQLGELIGMGTEDVDLLINKRRAHRTRASRLIFPGTAGPR